MLKAKAVHYMARMLQQKTRRLGSHRHQVWNIGSHLRNL